jgi:P27 family predicted phage terminase small subunit
MGRPKKTEAENYLQGTKSQSKPPTESHVPSGRPRIPSDLDKGLRRVFKDLCRLLSERRALSNGDVELVRLYVFVYERHRKEVAALREEGCVCTYYRLNNHGESVPQVKENLRLKIVSGCEKQMVTILAQLGLTPAAKDRARPVRQTADEEEVIPGSVEDYRRRGLLDGPRVVPINNAELLKEECDAETAMQDESETPGAAASEEN